VQPTRSGRYPVASPPPRRTNLTKPTWVWNALALVALAGSTGTAAAQDPLAGLDDAGLYRAACAACHGTDGRGAPQSQVALEVPLPDFSNCSFATREPDADWLAIAHQGGPVRGFDAMMPSFAEALSEEQLLRILAYIRTLCADPAWPRGELNLPRALVTEKAYPEDEAVWSATVALADPGEVEQEIVYEKRFGPRSQLELVVPLVFRERSAGNWSGGLGDVVVGVKHALAHSLEAGSILSVAGELKLPTGDEDDGFGAGTPVAEAFVAFGQILPADGFLQLQAIVERPFDADRAEPEAALRAVLGKTFAQGRWGRAWSPMIEVLAGRELEGGASLEWDAVPQLQVTLNTRQHVIGSVGVRLPVSDRDAREPALLVYVLWDWFDGGLRDGW
jgi:mono/diheme cytochrome c family protein